MHSTTAVDSRGLAEYAVANRNAAARAEELVVSDAAWYGRSTDPCSTAFSTFCLAGLNHLGINSSPEAKQSHVLRPHLASQNQDEEQKVVCVLR